MRIPTVKVKKDSQRGWSIINEADFDPEKHALFDAPDVEAPAQEQAAPDDFDSMGKDDLHEILDAHGVEYDGRTGVAKLREMAKRTVFVSF